MSSNKESFKYYFEVFRDITLLFLALCTFFGLDEYFKKEDNQRKMDAIVKRRLLLSTITPIDNDIKIKINRAFREKDGQESARMLDEIFRNQ